MVQHSGGTRVEKIKLSGQLSENKTGIKCKKGYSLLPWAFFCALIFYPYGHFVNVQGCFRRKTLLISE